MRDDLVAAGFDDDAFFVFDALPAAADCVFFAAVLVLGAVIFAVPTGFFCAAAMIPLPFIFLEPF